MDYRKKRKRKIHKHHRRLPLWLIVLICVLAVILFMAGVAYGYVQYTLGRIEKVDKAVVEKVSPENEDFETDESLPDESDGDIEYLDPESVVWDEADTTVMEDKDIVNLLLIGQDKRQGQGRQRSDAMIMVTINKKNSKISLTSFMRDMYVQIPGYSDNRINAAYVFGGMELLDETIEKNFGVHIDGNVEVDFQAFKKCIDKLGGLDMELTEEEAEYLNRKGNWGDNNASAGTWNLQEGMNHLTGEQALAFSRIRYVGNADYERTERQRRVLTKIFDKCKSADAITLFNLIEELVPCVTTDLTNGELLGYAWEVLNMGVGEMENYRIPVDGGYKSAVIRQMMVLVPDLAVNRAYLEEQLYSNLSEEE